jgi:hypothetical protein
LTERHLSWRHIASPRLLTSPERTQRQTGGPTQWNQLDDPRNQQPCSRYAHCHQSQVSESTITDISQRIKGAIDRTIAEEQARQRALLEARQQQQAQQTTGTSAVRRSRSSSTAGGQSPARRARPTKKPSQDLSSKDAGDGAANPDPAVFEAAFVIDDVDEAAAPSRTSTPSAADKEGTSDSGKQGTSSGTESPANGTDTPASGNNEKTSKDTTNPGASSAPAANPISELPPEIRARLRKLEKLEKTYPGLPYHCCPRVSR